MSSVSRAPFVWAPLASWRLATSLATVTLKLTATGACNEAAADRRATRRLPPTRRRPPPRRRPLGRPLLRVRLDDDLLAHGGALPPAGRLGAAHPQRLLLRRQQLRGCRARG